MLEQHIIEQDKKSGKYRQIAEYVLPEEEIKKTETEFTRDKYLEVIESEITDDIPLNSTDERSYTHYVSYSISGPHGLTQKIKKCTSLADALEFVKTEKLTNYLIDTL